MLPLVVAAALLAAVAGLVGALFPSPYQLLYIARPNPGDSATLYLTDLRGGVSHPLMEYLGWGSEAAWSPDGEQIVFSAFQQRVVRRDLFILDVRSGEIRQITNSDGDHNSPAWSPDGRYIAYQAQTDRSGGGVFVHDVSSWNIFIHDLHSGQSRVVYASANTDGTPAWSPDGRHLAFTSSTGVGVDNSRLMILDLETGQARQLTDGVRGLALWPSWSPDGTRIAFSVLNNDGTSELSIINADGTGQHSLLTFETAVGYSPVWSPDGRRIAFASDLHDGRYLHIFVTGTDGIIRRVSAGEGGYMRPQWRP
jgi:TolB protein